MFANGDAACAARHGCHEPCSPAGKILCRCLGITEHEVRAAVANGLADSLADVISHTGAGGGCTACHRLLRLVLAEVSVKPGGESGTVSAEAACV